MAIRVVCPNPACGKEHDVKAELAGKTVRCSFCQQVFVVPPAEAATAQPAVQSAIPNPQSAMQDPLIGQQIAYYRIESLLGKGGMGRVYKAQNLRLAKTCAIKILLSEALSEDPSMAERFIREARSAAAIQHPNVLPVQNVAKVQEDYFIEMDYVDGGTLLGLMRQRGKLDVKEAVRIIRDVAAALQAAHKKGIIHRDIKPSNVMLTGEGHVFVMDFGLAKAVQSKSGLTQQGSILGTPWYMSPEQAMAQPADHRSDIYSLGVMFYQVLTGSPPYTADSPVALLLQHKEAPVPDITQVLPDCPPAIAAMIRQMMAKNPAERYQSCAEIVNELNAFLAAPPGTMVVTDSMTRRPTVLLGAKSAGANAPRTPRGDAGGDAGKRSAAPLVLVLVLLLVLVLGAVVYVVTESRKGSALRVQGSGTTTETATPAPPPTPPVVGGGHPQVPQATAKQSPTVEEPSTQSAKSAKPLGLAQGGSADRPSAVSVAVPEPQALNPSVDLLSYLDDIKPVDEKIASGDFDAARSRVNLLKAKYPDLVAAKLANLDRIESFRKRCFDRVNSGAAKVSMEDVSRKYAFAGEIQQADEKGLKAKITKRWDSFTKEEVGNFCRKAANPKSREDFIALAAFLLEGQSADKDQEQAMDALGKASGLGADVSKELKYIETLKQAAKEYAEAEKRGKEISTAESAEKAEKSKEGDVIASAEGVKQSHKDEIATGRNGSGPRDDKGVRSASSAKSADRSFDDVYVATAATGDSPRTPRGEAGGEAGKIPHPLSKKTTKITHQGKRIDAPEGMALVPAGEFTMGEKESEHQVYLDAFFIGKYDVTNAEWKAFTDATGFTPLPSHWKGGQIPQGKENHPVVYVSWEDAQKYCEWVSQGTGREVRLPTEVQWEKAARGPKASEYPWGDSWDKRLCNNGYLLAQFGFKPNDEREDWTEKFAEWQNTDKGKEIIVGGGNTTPVGSFPKGKCFYGCFDMAGNVYEWCQDWFMTEYYRLKDTRKNPQGPTEDQADECDISGQKSKGRVLRGGSWNSISRRCRSLNREPRPPSCRTLLYGFRVVSSVPAR